MSRPSRLLLADDQPDVLEALRLLLKGEGYQVETARSPMEVLEAVRSREFDAVLADLNYTRDTTSGREGLDLLQQLVGLDATLPIIVMTAWASIDTAVEAMRRGAHDYVEKPWDNARLVAIVRNAVELGRALRRAQHLEHENSALRSAAATLPTLIAESPVMRPVLQLMARVGPSDANVLITGEHGTGKELVATWLHASSPRAQRGFVAVNMGGLSDGVFESELFGHVKGAFTDARSDRVGRFELADSGTIFLDEIANISMGQQSKLLRVLQGGELERVGSSKVRRVDVRVLSATNADLQEDVRAGRFREDLLFRLNTIEIHLPALRERRDDIAPLARAFLQRHAHRYRKALEGFEPGAMQALLEHAWPGNIRELGHAVERAVLMAQGPAIRAVDLGLRVTGPSSPRYEDLSLEEVEQILIRKALARHGGNVSQAAKALGLSRSALYRRLEHFRIEPGSAS
ncbi:MAG: sigma-54-dependent Fis family transcriptional regulator [Gemmatimonadetes bacterium]|nr:sigma-54-dependent Fis family transcriptional regulator [Gemmatimonadota bacterium]HNV76766.1 sigma-54 dependent transcriptional regulator [Gemmatimonadaceae bacterium]MBK6841003.1 sigma-54-dependent Fis family transcriptional regulator [Gemmatimonadota bacterium]MBK7834683.1 sigma-54-dependent Fis family transcriptional regulator [Gemmatimonadota bacterium]MBK8056566.1 sigma-54-dependent Fis family transcriptional regulator [Gemmatimonadota bacterium]